MSYSEEERQKSTDRTVLLCAVFGAAVFFFGPRLLEEHNDDFLDYSSLSIRQVEEVTIGSDADDVDGPVSAANKGSVSFPVLSQ